MLDPTNIEAANSPAPPLLLGRYSFATASLLPAPDPPMSESRLSPLGPPRRCCHDALLPPLQCQIQPTMKSRSSGAIFCHWACHTDIASTDVAAINSKPCACSRKIRKGSFSSVPIPVEIWTMGLLE
eukprot:g36320.t1